MAMDFPAAPAVDDIFTDPGSGKAYTFDGSAWKIKTTTTKSGRISLGIANSIRFAQILSGPCMIKGVVQKIYTSGGVTIPFEFSCANGALAGDGTMAGEWEIFVFGEFRKGGPWYHLNPAIDLYRNGAGVELVFASGNNQTDIWLTYSVLAGDPIIAPGPVAGTRINGIQPAGSGGPPAFAGITG